MTVLELIAKLYSLNMPNATVILYNYNEECDCDIDSITPILKVPDPAKDYDEVIEYTKGYSVVEDNYVGESIVYLIGGY